MFMECCDNSQYKLDTGSVLSLYERTFKQPEEITPRFYSQHRLPKVQT
jgi:hypothetical protein